MSVLQRKYGTATAAGTHIRIPIVKAGGNDFATDSDWIPAAGDVKLSKNGGAQANIGTLPTYSNGAWEFQLALAELQCKQLEIIVVDSATKAVEDQCILIETFGHASAMYRWDPQDAVRQGMTALPDAAADGAGGLPISDAGGLDLDAKLANTNEVTSARMGVLTDWINGGRLDLLLDAIPTTPMRGTDGANTTVPDAAGTAKTLTGGERNSIADAVLARAAQNVEDTADKHSLAGLILFCTNYEISGNQLIAKKPSDDSEFQAYTLTSDAAADPVTGVS